MDSPQNGISKFPRAVRRCHEGGRLEELLWMRVFDELWPRGRRPTRHREIGGDHTPLAESDSASVTAKGAQRHG